MSTAITATDCADAAEWAARTLLPGFSLDAAGTIGVGLALLPATGDVLFNVLGGGVLILKFLLISLEAYLQHLRKAAAPLPETPWPEPEQLLTAYYHEAVNRDQQAIHGKLRTTRRKIAPTLQRVEAILRSSRWLAVLIVGSRNDIGTLGAGH